MMLEITIPQYGMKRLVCWYQILGDLNDQSHGSTIPTLSGKRRMICGTKSMISIMKRNKPSLHGKVKWMNTMPQTRLGVLSGICTITEMLIIKMR